MKSRGWVAERFQHPAQIVAVAFAVAILLGTVLLSLPVSTTAGERPRLIDALFTATSAVCLTGLAVVDIGTYWSPFGEAVILILVQVGGLGIMTLATLVMLLLWRRIGVRARLATQVETKTPGLQGIRRVVRNIVLFSLGSEAVAATLLAIRFATGYDEPVGRAVYHGVFHAVSAFNNAGLSPYPDSLTRFVTDPWICLTVAAAVVVGGLGFPVVFELARAWRRPAHWSVMTRLTVIITGVLLVGGTLLFTITEASNPRTFGPLEMGEKLLAGFFHSAMTRSGGFNTVDTSAMRPESLLASDILMFIGGGSAGTAGGIKVTTFGLLAFVIWSEMRGEPHVNVGWRRVPESNQRQALTIALLGIGAVAVSTFILLAATSHTLERVLFEVISASATVGLSVGVVGDLPPGAVILLTVLMFVGRVGPLTVASALALRDRARRFELPEERTIVG